MKTLNAIIFPDITPAAATVLPLVHIFSSVVYCRPVENDPIPEIEQARKDIPSCTIHIPAPLQEDRERFLQLINDLQNRRDDYASQLSQLSLAGLPRSSRPDPESKNSILSSLLKSKGIISKTADRKNEANNLILWQARLILKLGEIFDLEQARLSHDLAHIKDKRDKIFSDLQGGDDLSFQFTEKISQISEPTEGQQGLRLKAWSRLLFLGEPFNENNLVYITRHQDDFNRLADEYDNLRSIPPHKLASIALPLRDFKKTATPAPDFNQEAAASLEQLKNIIRHPMEAEKSADPLIMEQWHSLLEKYYPKAAYGRCRLNLYSFANISASQLFLNSFAGDTDLTPADLSTTNSYVIIGVLEKEEKYFLL